MGITFIPQRSVLVPTTLGASATNGSGETLFVGAEVISGIEWTGSSINSNVTEVADIDNPSTWTNLVSITGKSCLMQLDSIKSTSVRVNSDETSGNALRMQILRDGDVIFDAKVVADASNTFNLSLNPLIRASGSYSFYEPVYCKNSFIIRVARKGTISSSSSKIRMSNIHYNEVKLV